MFGCVRMGVQNVKLCKGQCFFFFFCCCFPWVKKQKQQNQYWLIYWNCFDDNDDYSEVEGFKLDSKNPRYYLFSREKVLIEIFSKGGL